jgi:hypothetical protein
LRQIKVIHEAAYPDRAVPGRFGYRAALQRSIDLPREAPARPPSSDSSNA